MGKPDGYFCFGITRFRVAGLNPDPLECFVDDRKLDLFLGTRHPGMCEWTVSTCTAVFPAGNTSSLSEHLFNVRLIQLWPAGLAAG